MTLGKAGTGSLWTWGWGGQGGLQPERIRYAEKHTQQMLLGALALVLA